MAKKLAQPRYIRPENIRIGDTIRATWTVGEVEHSRVATVHKRDYEGADRVLFARDGQEILRWHPAHKGPRITLIAEAPDEPQPMLFDMDEVRDRIA